MAEVITVCDSKRIVLDLSQDQEGLARQILANGLQDIYSLNILEKQLPFDHLALQVAHDLHYQGLLNQGCSLSFDFYVKHRSPQSNVDALIKQSQTLFKIIGTNNWSDFVKQITDYSYRPKLRTTAETIKTHKLVHNTKEIILYNKEKKAKAPYTHTKKQSATLLSPNLNTRYFGQQHDNPAVGFIKRQLRLPVDDN